MPCIYDSADTGSRERWLVSLHTFLPSLTSSAVAAAVTAVFSVLQRSFCLCLGAAEQEAERGRIQQFSQKGCWRFRFPCKTRVADTLWTTVPLSPRHLFFVCAFPPSSDVTLKLNEQGGWDRSPGRLCACRCLTTRLKNMSLPRTRKWGFSTGWSSCPSWHTSLGKDHWGYV